MHAFHMLFERSILWPKDSSVLIFPYLRKRSKPTPSIMKISKSKHVGKSEQPTCHLRCQCKTGFHACSMDVCTLAVFTCTVLAFTQSHILCYQCAHAETDLNAIWLTVSIVQTYVIRMWTSALSYVRGMTCKKIELLSTVVFSLVLIYIWIGI